jgi:rhodanese-related sulfurtransferase
MYNRNLAKVLAQSYKILALILILIAGGLLFLPKYERHEGIDPEELLANAISPERYISADELAHKIISNDPSVLIIDVRDAESFNSYSIPGSLNIPLGEILDEQNQSYLNQNAFEVIFYSDEDFFSDQAWILCNRLGYKNLRVLKGGLNSWFDSIINPPIPGENLPATAHDLYTFRKAASMYFGVVYPDEVIVESVPVEPMETKAVVPVKKKKKKVPEGGC